MCAPPTVDMLSELGYRVLKAENAEQALTILMSGAPVDLLFTDVVMPGPIGVRANWRAARRNCSRISSCSSPPATRRTPSCTTASWTTMCSC